MDLLFVIGRVLFGGLFLYNGLNHLLHYEATRGYIAYKQVPLPAAAMISERAIPGCLIPKCSVHEPPIDSPPTCACSMPRCLRNFMMIWFPTCRVFPTSMRPPPEPPWRRCRLWVRRFRKSI